LQTGEAQPATAKTVVCIGAGRRAALLVAIAGVWLAAHPRVLAAQATPCLRNAALSASFSVSCASFTCTLTNTSSPPPAGFSALEWDFGDGGFLQGPPASTSPASHTYAAGGSYLVTLTLTGGDGQVAVATGSVTLGGPPIPLAADDAFTTPKDTPLVIGIAELLSNDLPGVTFYQVSGCALSPAGDSCTYTPPPNQVGVFGFTYSVRDAVGNQGSANVFVTVTQPLVANPDYFSTFIGVPIQITSAQLLANDQPPSAVFVRAENPVNGTLSYLGQNAQGAAVYQFTPTGQSVGSGSFDYLISLDGSPPYAMGFVYVNVADAPPVAAFTVQCTNMQCTVHSTSSDDTGTIPTYVWDWGDGTVVTPQPPYQWADQMHTYVHSGRYTITLTVTDTAALTSSLQLAVVANIPPVAVNDTATTTRDLPVIINVLANDSDPDGDPLFIASVDLHNYPGASWQVVPLGSSWAIKVTPPDNFVGTMTFTYVAYDPMGATATATVTLTVNQTQVILEAMDQQFWCQQNGSIRIGKAALLAVAYDSTGATLTIVGIDKSVLSGTLDCDTDPTACTFTPPSYAYGVTLFRYTVAEPPPAARQDTGTVRIYVGSYGQAPTANDVYFTTTRNTPKVFTIQDVVQNDVDPDGDSLSMALQSGPTAFGSLICTTPMYSCTYTPNPGYVGTDRFLYSASDGIYPPVTATINILTLPPTTATFDAREDLIVTPSNQSAFFSNAALTSNDYAPSGGPITVTSIDTTGLLGTLSCDSFGCTYNPPFYFSGATTFKYTATDGYGATDTAIVKIKVGVTNHPPVAVPQTLLTPKNTPLRFSVFDLMKNDYDPDDDPLTVTMYAFTAHLGTLSCGTPNYWCVYTPNPNTTGADAITYLLSDGTNSVTPTVTINITNTTP
jgi:hypothetical protein